jgi:DNA-binding NtrC family response regulator
MNIIKTYHERSRHMGKILIVDDDDDLRNIVKDILIEEGFLTSEAPDGLIAIEIFKKDIPDAVLLDLKMPHMNGIETMKELLKIDRCVPIIILTAHGDIPTAVHAIKYGAYDFTLKPPEFDRLIITLKRAVEKRMLEMEIEKTHYNLELSLEHLLGKSNTIKKVIKQILQVSQTDFSVIIQGETGTGKSFVASAIHNMSKRTNKPLIAVDIGLIPDSLVESELFGHKKGSFTGAERDKAGYFEVAHHGTIFIDELENISPYMQGKLLTVIDKKKIYPLGSTTPVDIDVRIIASTNKDIRQSVLKKEFREDLFYRLGEFIIDLPPLRERIDDIPFFANKFIYEASTELNTQIKEITEDALVLLTKHNWPGNVRELKNVMRRALLLAKSDVINQECIEFLIIEHDSYKDISPRSSLKNAVRALEKQQIQAALKKTSGNKTKAAELLDISYRTLFEKIKEYGLT